MATATTASAAAFCGCGEAASGCNALEINVWVAEGAESNTVTLEPGMLDVGPGGKVECCRPKITGREVRANNERDKNGTSVLQYAVRGGMVAESAALTLRCLAPKWYLGGSGVRPLNVLVCRICMYQYFLFPNLSAADVSEGASEGLSMWLDRMWIFANSVFVLMMPR